MYPAVRNVGSQALRRRALLSSPRALLASPRALLASPRALVASPRALVASPRLVRGRVSALTARRPLCAGARGGAAAAADDDDGEEDSAPLQIETSVTPNPQSLKFFPGRPVLGEGGVTRDYSDAAMAAADSALAAAIFDVSPSVSNVFLGPDFVSVNLRDGADWTEHRALVFDALSTHYASGRPAVRGDPTTHPRDAPILDGADPEDVALIRQLIEERIRPTVQDDGGDVAFRGFVAGTVYLEMQGSCASCPSSTATLKFGIENMLTHYVPQVRAVEDYAALKEDKDELEELRAIAARLRAGNEAAQ
jgi:Fe-S cluster biogenesis protein NfuA